MIWKPSKFLSVAVAFAYLANATGYAFAADYGSAIPNASKYLTDLDSFETKIDK